MTEYVANDFAAIAARLKELEAEKGGPPGCVTCEGRGWKQYHAGSAGTFWGVCGTCSNPMGKPHPVEAP